jgi:hypothetical protein
MSGENKKHTDPPLERVSVYQGPQTKAMQFYVPLTVFAVECVVLLMFFRLFQFQALLFVLPIHLLLMLKTSSDSWWVENLICNLNKKVLAKNRGIRGKNVVTFSPHTPRRELRGEYALFRSRKSKRGSNAQ